MSQTPARGGRTASFANLLSLARGAKGARAEDDRRPEDQDDEEARKARRAEEDERRKEEDARRAEEDDRRKEEDARRAEEDEGDPEDDGKKGKKADKEDGDDERCEEEDDPDAKVAAAARAGRLAERARWAKALGAEQITAANVGAACVMLATTPMTSAAVLQAVTALPSASAAARRPSLDERMSANRPANPGADGGSAPDKGAKGVAAQILAAGDKARGKK